MVLTNREISSKVILIAFRKERNSNAPRQGVRSAWPGGLHTNSYGNSRQCLTDCFVSDSLFFKSLFHKDSERYPLMCMAVSVVLTGDHSRAKPQIIPHSPVSIARCSKESVMNSQGIRVILLITVFTLAVASAGANVSLFVSFPDALPDKIIYGIIGGAFDIVKVFALVAAAALALDGHHGKALALRVLWGCLVLASLLAAYGFMAFVNAEREETVLKASDNYAAAKGAVETAQQKVSALSAYASPNIKSDAEAEIKKLEAGLNRFLNSDAANSNGHTIGTVSDVIGKYGCGGFYGGLCAEKDRIEQAIREQREAVAKHEAYAGAMAHRQAMLDNLAGIKDRPESVTHAQWIAIAGIFGTSPEAAKRGVTLFLSSLIEALCALGLWSLSGLRSQRVFNAEELRYAMIQAEQHRKQLSGMLPALEPDALSMAKKA